MRKSIMVLVMGMALGAPGLARANFGNDGGFTSINPAVGVVMSGAEGLLADNQLKGAARGTKARAQGTPQWLRADGPVAGAGAPTAGRLRKLAAARVSAR